MFKIYQSLLVIILKDKSSFKFALGVVLSLSFSIAVILSTIGIMDGFKESLQSSLRGSEGDIIIKSSDGFFQYSEELSDFFNSEGINNISPLVNIEGFIIKDNISKGILIKGVIPESFNRVTNLNLNLNNNDIVIGSELAKDLSLKINDFAVLAFGKNDVGLPQLNRFRVSGIVNHNIYEKNLRFVYIKQSVLQEVSMLEDYINAISILVPKGEASIDVFTRDLNNRLDLSFRAVPFWQEFATLLEAVKVEKLVIGIILQLIVVISIFNVLAFIVFVDEKKSKELFLLKALGLGQKKILIIWSYVVVTLWAISCTVSLLLVKIFDLCLQHLSIFKLPGDIYHLGQLDIIINGFDYLLVFGATLLWILLLSWSSFRKIGNRSILHGLRKEFS